MLLPIRNKHILGSDTRERLVHSSTCPELQTLGIALTGLTDAAPPYTMAEEDPKRTYLLVCTGGEGRVWTNGRWETCGHGDAYITRPHQPLAFTARKGLRWQFTWIFFSHPRPWHRILPEQNARIRGVEGLALSSAVEGLYRELGSATDPDMRRYWIALIDNYWRRVAENRSSGGRLALLWEKVDQSLAHSWTLAELAKHAGMSDEHLRRLSKQETGRSPMMQVAWMRMSRAAALLQTTNLRVDAVAEAVGYSSAFAFSTAFRRIMGCPPSRYLT